MKMLSTGEPSTLGTYKKMSIIFGQKAIDFIQAKIDESPNGEDEEVIADERQMIYLLSQIASNSEEAEEGV